MRTSICQIILLASFAQICLNAQAGRVLSMDGFDDFVVTGSVFPQSSNLVSFTAEAWFYPKDIESVLLSDGAYDVVLVLNVSNNQPGISFRIWGSETNYTDLVDFGRLKLNEWNHVAATFNAETKKMRLAINGIFSSRVKYFDGDRFFLDGTQFFVVGGPQSPGSAVFHGEIDEVRISDAIRYDNDFVPVPTFRVDGDTVALFRFNEPPGATLFFDSSPSRFTLGGENGATIVQSSVPTPGDLGPVTITVAPRNQNAASGSTVIFRVEAEGRLPFSYQWKFNGANVAGATNSTFVIGNVSSSNAGTYSVTVLNRDSSDTSDPATLVLDKPGAKLWEFPTGGAVYSSPALGSDGTVYFGSGDGNLYAVRKDGTKLWEFKTDAGILGSPSIGADGTIYVGSHDHHLYAINPDGSKRWDYTTGDRIFSSPALGTDGAIYFGSDDGYLYALFPDGRLNWRLATGGTVSAEPTIGADGTIYIGSKDHTFYALTSQGSKKWEFQADDEITAGAAIATDGTIYFGAEDGVFYALKPDGALKWKFAAGRGITSNPAIGTDGTIYLTSRDVKCYALRPDGTKLWEFGTYASIFSSPAIAADGTIYFGSHDFTFYAVLPDGSLKWQFDAEHFVGSAPTITRDGAVYVGSRDGKLYALKDTSPPALSAWPMFMHDTQHTGRVPASGTDSRLFLSMPQLSGTTGFQFVLNGAPSKNYRIEISTNLIDWTLLANIASTNSTVTIVDGSAISASRKFYRAVVAQP